MPIYVKIELYVKIIYISVQNCVKFLEGEKLSQSDSKAFNIKSYIGHIYHNIGPGSMHTSNAAWT